MANSAQDSEQLQPEQHGERVPTVLLLCTDLMFGVQLQNMVRKAGGRYVSVQQGAPLPRGDIMVADLAARADVPGRIREAAAMGIPVVAFGPHLDTQARKAAKAAGAARALSNAHLARDLPVILRTPA